LDKAEKRLFIALDKSDRVNDKILEASIIFTLAQIHFEKGLPEKSRELCEQALSITEKSYAQNLRASIRLALGKCHGAQSDWQKAKALMERSLRTAHKLKLHELIQYASYELAKVYQKLGNTKKAQELYTLAQKTVQQVADKLDEPLKAAYLSHHIRKAIKEDAEKLASQIQGAPTVTDNRDVLSEAGISPALPVRDGITLLGMVSRIMGAGLDPDKMLDLALGMLIEVTRAQRGFIILVDEQGRLSHRAAQNIEDNEIDSPDFSRSIVEQVLESGQSRIIEDALGDEQLRLFRSVVDLKLRAVLCVPVQEKGNTLGAVYLDNTSVSRQFVEEDKALVEVFAEKIAVLLEMSLEYEEQAHTIEQLRGELQTRYQYENIIGKSKAMRKVFEVLDRIIPTDLNVYIYGETGTGKELVAKAIHYNGPRKEKPFISINCGAIPELLLESELFGYVKGAFTGADRDKKGLFEIANGGTLFLDEIGNMPGAMQRKLLRVLQEKEIRPIGSEEVIEIDVRIVSATNRDLNELVECKEFREDLYYRLKVVEVTLPPLRARREDISLLAEHFLEQVGTVTKKELEPAALDLLLDYDWPGNVRELESLIHTCVTLSSEKITGAGIKANLSIGGKTTFPLDTLQRGGIIRLEEMERDYIKKVLSIVGGNKSEAARVLGISRMTLRKKLKELPPNK
jgi:Nif-specific regulatory protein